MRKYLRTWTMFIILSILSLHLFVLFHVYQSVTACLFSCSSIWIFVFMLLLFSFNCFFNFMFLILFVCFNVTQSAPVFLLLLLILLTLHLLVCLHYLFVHLFICLYAHILMCILCDHQMMNLLFYLCVRFLCMKCFYPIYIFFICYIASIGYSLKY